MDFEVNVTFFNCSIKAWVWTTDCGRVQKSQFNFWQSAMHQKQVFSLTPISSTSLILAEFLDRKLKNLLFYMAKFFETEKGKSIPNWKTPIDLDTWTISVQHEGQSQNPDGKKSPPYPYVRAAAYIPTFLAFFQFRIPDWFRSSSIYDYKRSRSQDIFQIFICHFDVTLYFIHGMNFPYLRIEMILRLQKIIFGPKLEILDFIYFKMFSSD